MTQTGFTTFLEGKIACVIGGTRGIGAAAARLVTGVVLPSDGDYLIA